MGRMPQYQCPCWWPCSWKPRNQSTNAPSVCIFVYNVLKFVHLVHEPPITAHVALRPAAVHQVLLRQGHQLASGLWHRCHSHFYKMIKRYHFEVGVLIDIIIAIVVINNVMIKRKVSPWNGLPPSTQWLRTPNKIRIVAGSWSESHNWCDKIIVTYCIQGHLVTI